jgi:hypothetical protein
MADVEVVTSKQEASRQSEILETAFEKTAADYLGRNQTL